MHVDWSRPTQDGFANVRLVGILNVKEGPTHVVVRLDENGYDVCHNIHVVYENGCVNNSGIPSAFDVTNKEVRRILYVLYDSKGDYVTSHVDLGLITEYESVNPNSRIVKTNVDIAAHIGDV